MTNLNKKIVLHVLLPLLLGYFIYFFFRPHFWFIEIIDNRESLINISNLNWLQKIVIFSGSDFCWAYSLSSALFIWHQWQKNKISFFPLIILFVVIFSEAIQWSSPKFTFDWGDMLAAILAFILSYIIIFKNAKG